MGEKFKILERENERISVARERNDCAPNCEKCEFNTIPRKFSAIVLGKSRVLVEGNQYLQYMSVLCCSTRNIEYYFSSYVEAQETTMSNLYFSLRFPLYPFVFLSGSFFLASSSCGSTGGWVLSPEVKERFRVYYSCFTHEFLFFLPCHGQFSFVLWGATVSLSFFGGKSGRRWNEVKEYQCQALNFQRHTTNSTNTGVFLARCCVTAWRISCFVCQQNLQLLHSILAPSAGPIARAMM